MYIMCGVRGDQNKTLDPLNWCAISPAPIVLYIYLCKCSIYCVCMFMHVNVDAYMPL